MTDNTSGFIVQKDPGKFRVDGSRVAPESLLVTELLVQAIVRRRHLATGRMLDIGCGTKPYAVVFADQVTRHIGVDVPYCMHGLNAIDGFAPSHALPFPRDTFDFVLCTEVLEHVPDPARAWAEIGRVLRPGGVAIVTTPFLYRFHEMPHDYWRITPPAHRLMASQAGLTVEEIAHRGGYLSVLADTHLKGLAFFVRAIRKILRRPARPGSITRACFALVQWPLIRLLSRESIKTDEFTIGLVVVARKPR
jgi:SAM-dependent methyltransferase